MKFKRFAAALLSAALCMTALSGCAQDNTLSRYIDENGCLKDVDVSAVKLTDYKNMVIPKENHTPAEETVTAWMSYQIPSKNVTEGKVYDGATLNIDYVGYIDDVPFEGGDTNGMGTDVTIGVTQYIDDFLQQLVGHNVGENFDIEVTFPEDYGNEELNGKDAVFNITINHIKEPVKFEEIDDELVKQTLGEQGINTVEQLREKAVETLSQDMVNSYIYTEVFEKSTVDSVAQTAIDFQGDYIIETTKQQAEAYGMTLEDMLSYYNMGSAEEFKQANAELISDAAKELCISQAIAQQEGITVTDEDVEEYFGGQDYSSVEKKFGKNFIKFIILQGKTISHLTENIKRGE